MIHMWTNGHCLNSVGGNIGGHYSDHPHCQDCLDKRGQEEIEDPLHLFVGCEAYGEQREHLLSALEAIRPGFRSAYAGYADKDKLRSLMVEAHEGILRTHGTKEKAQVTGAERQCAAGAVCRFLDDALNAHPARQRWRRHFTK